MLNDKDISYLNLMSKVYLLNNKQTKCLHDWVEWPCAADETFGLTRSALCNRCCLGFYFNSRYDHLPIPGATESCSHKFKAYVGLTETYEYCEACDVKR